MSLHISESDRRPIGEVRQSFWFQLNNFYDMLQLMRPRGISMVTIYHHHLLSSLFPLFFLCLSLTVCNVKMNRYQHIRSSKINISKYKKKTLVIKDNKKWHRKWISWKDFWLTAKVTSLKQQTPMSIRSFKRPVVPMTIP